MSRWATIVALLASVGCAGPLARSRGQFEGGHYAEARRSLEELEGMARTWDVEERAAYALYRGLASGAVGDVGRAREWLRVARDLERGRPGALARGDAMRLREGLATYEVR